MKVLKSWIFVVFAILIIGTLSGCGGGGGGGGGVAPEPVPSASLFISNFSDDYIINVYISPSSSGGWGNNLLSYPIEPWGSQEFIIYDCNQNFDVRAEMDQDYYEPAEYYGNYIECGGVYELDIEWDFGSVRNSVSATTVNIISHR